MEKIVVSDTNIFIDLISVNLLDGFFSLPWEIHTTDMIMKELKDSKARFRIRMSSSISFPSNSLTFKLPSCLKASTTAF